MAGTTGPDVEGTWAKLRRRKVVQWGVAYAAAAWGLLQGLAYLVDTFHWPELIQQLATILLLVGLPIVIVVAWYHGDRGVQRVGGTEISVITVLLLLGAGLVWQYDRVHEEGATDTEVSKSKQAAHSGAIRSLAVMPLENLSNDPEQQFFVDGMHDELIARLSKLGSVKVISSMSTMHYRDAPKPVADVGRELGVEGLVQGSVRRVGNRVAITVQLVRAATGENLWAETYQRDLTDVLLMQSEMAQAIARAIGAALTPAQRSSLTAARKVNPAAYDAYLRGRQAWVGTSIPELWQAKEWYEKSIALDPGFALAYANLGLAYLHLGIRDQMRRHDAYAEAERLQEKAVELEDTPAIRLYLATTRANTRHAWPELTKVMDDALAIDANNALVYNLRAQMLAFLGHNDEAIAALRKRIELDPLCRPACEVMLADFHRWAHHEEESLRILQAVLKQYPDSWGAWQTLAFLDLQRGATKDAVAAADTMTRLAPDEPWSRQTRAYVYAKAGRVAEARRILAEIETDWSAGRPSSPVMIGLIRLTLGERDQFFQWLERGFDDYDPELFQLQDPIFDPVRDDPRFRWAMKRRSGQVQGPYVPAVSPPAR